MTRKRKLYEDLLAESPAQARLWIALEAMPRPPHPYQRIRWILAAQERYLSGKRTMAAFRRYAETLVRHMGEEAAVAWIERYLATPRDGRNPDV